MGTPTIATVVFPAREFEAGVNAWTSVFGTGPAFSSSGQQTAPGEADFAVFKTPDIEIALTSLPWVDAPLVFLDTDDIEQTRQELVDSGATGLEIDDFGLGERRQREVKRERKIDRLRPIDDAVLLSAVRGEDQHREVDEVTAPSTRAGRATAAPPTADRRSRERQETWTLDAAVRT